MLLQLSHAELSQPMNAAPTGQNLKGGSLIEVSLRARVDFIFTQGDS